MPDDLIFRTLADEHLIDLPTSPDLDLGGVADRRYVYSDPTTDAAWPRIAQATDDDVPDCFPAGWGGAPTERDQAAIDAGNA